MNNEAPAFPIQMEFPVIPAFEVGGTWYYHYQDPENTPAGRMVGALKYYIQMQTMCDESYLQRHYERVKEIYSDPKKINVTEIMRLNEQLGERLTIMSQLPDQDLILRYASVIYFDAEESPYTYDDSYCEEKIAKWRGDRGVVDFMLREPIRSLVPSLRNVNSSSRARLLVQAADMINLKHLELLLTGTSGSESSEGSISKLLSRKEILEERIASAGGQSQSTSHSSKRNSRNGDKEKKN